jgi:hypothetical protein
LFFGANGEGGFVSDFITIFDSSGYHLINPEHVSRFDVPSEQSVLIHFSVNVGICQLNGEWCGRQVLEFFGGEYGEEAEQ